MRGKVLKRFTARVNASSPFTDHRICQMDLLTNLEVAVGDNTVTTGPVA